MLGFDGLTAEGRGAGGAAWTVAGAASVMQAATMERSRFMISRARKLSAGTTLQWARLSANFSAAGFPRFAWRAGAGEFFGRGELN